ncbi:MAG TPA: hypothetical protein VNO17_11910 [Actinomycetota bacterium]|nr:hypothetical protein [Actinomycetota bacterium]
MPDDPLPDRPVYTHTGSRYVLGYLPDAFAIWDRASPEAPVERFPRTDEGWAEAWRRYTTIEPTFAEVGRAGPPAEAAHQYTHSGRRYLLGYGERFFGIWDRGSPEAPVERFPRTDEGWAEAWRRFVQLEPEPAAVGLSPTRPPERWSAAPAAGRPAVGWWLLPILFGLIGGFIAWLANKDVDARLAGWFLLAGAGSSTLALVLYLSYLSR